MKLIEKKIAKKNMGTPELSPQCRSTRLDKFEMLETVGEGAYGIVWKARNRGNFFISQYSAHLIQIFLLSFFSYILL